MESFRIALRALMSNKARAALTMLGVIIGVSAVILLVAIGSGVQQEITGQVEGLGSNLLFVIPGAMEGGGGPTGGGGSFKSFTFDEVDLLEQKLGNSALVVPIMQGSVTLKAGNRTLRSTLSASSQDGDEVFTSDFAAGRYFTRSEYATGARVIILGDTPAEELFPGQNALGREVFVEGERFTVIGRMAAQGGTLTGDADNAVYMPATTAQRLLNTTDFSTIIVKAEDPERIEVVKAQIQQALRPSFGDEFSVFTQEQTLGLLSTLLGTLTVMLAGIAGISLLVGGIGIMNIMLVSVSERTREIGIRKAVGARTYDIMSQFVIEAVVLSVAGGVIGILIGWVGAAALNGVVPTQVTWWAVALAFTFSAAVGIFFGVYPAWKASRLDPIEALRYE